MGESTFAFGVARPLRALAVSVAALVVYRACALAPLPGLDPGFLEELLGRDAFPAFFGLSGAGWRSGSLLALGVSPLVSALILAEALRLLHPRLWRWTHTPQGSRRLGQGIVIGALALAAVGALGIARHFESLPEAVAEPGAGFRAGVILALVAATALVALLATWITRAGVGYGPWVLLLADSLGFVEFHFRHVEHALAAGSVSRWIAFTAQAYPLLLLLALGSVLALFVRAKPRLSDPEELIWSPLLGFAAVDLLLGGAIRAAMLFPGSGGKSTVWLSGFYDTSAFTLLSVVAVSGVLLLRRRRLASPARPFLPAQAVPVLAVLSAALILAREAPRLSGGLLLPFDPELLLLSVGVALGISETLRIPRLPPALP